MYEITLTGFDEAQMVIDTIQRRGMTMLPLLMEFGEHTQNSIQDNFQTSTAPDGTAWAKNSPVTMSRYLGKKKGKARERSAGGKRPLIGKSGFGGGLAGTIRYQVNGNKVVVGSNKPQAAVMHFGAKQGEFGRSKRGMPLPWGDIPARPYLGIRVADKQILLEIATDYLTGY